MPSSSASPLFFELGIVLLIPVVMLVAQRAKQPLVLVGIPALAGLSALHGLVLPHPGPLIAIDALGADLGITLGLGLLLLAIGAGSVFLSHVNNAGFWLVKEYFGMTVGETFAALLLRETLLSVVAGARVVIIGAILGVL